MYAERHPGPALADRVACEWHRTSDTGGTTLVVPDACVDVIWGADGLFVAGPDTMPIPVTMKAGATLVGIRFRPGAVGDFFGVPLADLRNGRIPLSDLPGRHPVLTELTDHPAADPGWPTSQAAEVEWAISQEGARSRAASQAADRDRMGQIDARLRALRTAIGKRLTGSAPIDPAARAMATALRQGSTVAEVAWTLGFSERQLQRRSLASFGYAPKTLQRIVRFQRALKLARAGVPLAEVAVTAGYTDQAHLANDVKRLGGVPMGRLL